MSDGLRRERLQHEGLLLEKENQAKHLRLKCEGLRDSVRTYMDPIAKIEDLEIDVAFEAMTGLVGSHLKLTELLGEIKNIKKALGKT